MLFARWLDIFSWSSFELRSLNYFTRKYFNFSVATRQVVKIRDFFLWSILQSFINLVTIMIHESLVFFQFKSCFCSPLFYQINISGNEKYWYFLTVFDLTMTYVFFIFEIFVNFPQNYFLSFSFCKPKWMSQNLKTTGQK